MCQSVSWEDTLTLVLLRATRDLAGGEGGVRCLQLHCESLCDDGDLGEGRDRKEFYRVPRGGK